MAVGSPLGYLVYLAFVFLPGIGLGEILRLWKDGSTLIERVALALGLGLAVDTLVLFFRTSGVSLLGHALFGIDLLTIYLVIGFSLALLGVSLTLRRKFTFYVKPRRIDLWVSLVMVGLGVMLVAYFAKYPIFPEYQSEDFGNHVLYSTDLIRGTAGSLPSGILYFGVEYQLAASILLVGGQALVTARATLGLLVFLSPLLLYLVSVRLFSNKIAAIMVTLVYAFSGTLWFDSVFNSGLYANFFGLIASLFLITAFVEVADNLRSKAYWVFFVLAIFMAYMSHYSTLTVLPAIALTGLVGLMLGRRKGVRYVIPAFVLLAPVLVIAVAYPSLVQTVLNLGSLGQGTVSGSTALSSSLSAVPVLQYMAVEVYDDLAFVILLALAAFYTYKSAREKSALLFLPVIWFLAVFIASPENLNAWRFSFVAIIPLTLMAGQGMGYFFPQDEFGPKRRPGRRSSRATRTRSELIAVVVVGLLVIGSWGTTMLSDSFTTTQVSSSSQGEVLQAIQWLDNGTAPNSVYLSVSDWRFTLTETMIGRTGYYQFESTPQAALPQAKADNADYIIVTNIVTVSLPPDPTLYPWNNFQPSSNLTLVYNNPDVEIFKIP